MKLKFLATFLFVLGVYHLSPQPLLAQILGNHNLVYGATPDVVIDKMFDMAKLSKKDIFFDLGCGDGRVVARAAEKFGCRSVGVDLNHVRIRQCMDLVKNRKLENLVEQGLIEFRLGNALNIPDLSTATVVFLYMTPDFMERFRQLAETQLKPGARIVAHDYRWLTSGWEPNQKVEVRDEIQKMHFLYLWTVKD